MIDFMIFQVFYSRISLIYLENITFLIVFSIFQINVYTSCMVLQFEGFFKPQVIQGLTRFFAFILIFLSGSA